MKLRALSLILSLFCLPSGAPCQWAQTEGPSRAGITSIAVLGTRLFASAMEANANIYESNDDGLTWTPLYNTSGNEFAISGSVLFLGSWTDGVRRSTDSGVSWSHSSLGLTDTNVKSLAVVGTKLFAGTQAGGVFCSTDSGATWTLRSTGLTNDTVPSLAVLGTTLLAGTNAGIFRSTDLGKHWVSSNNGVFSNRRPADPYVTGLVVIGSELFAGTARGGIFRSADSGKIWNSSSSGMGFSTPYSLAASGKYLYAGTMDWGLFRSIDNGVNWEHVVSNITSTAEPFSVYTLATPGNVLLAGTNFGAYRSLDEGVTWSGASGAMTSSAVTSLVIKGSHIFAGTNDWGGGIFCSADLGQTWYADQDSVLNAWNPIDVFTLRASDSNMFLSGNGVVFRSSDEGTSWAVARNGLAAGNIFALATKDSYLYSGTSNGMFLTTDGGVNWTDSRTIGYGCDTILSLTVSGTSLFAGTKHCGIFRTDDHGSHWISVNDNILDGYSVPLLYSTGAHVFAITDSGLFRTTDFGTNWIHLINKLPANASIGAFTNSDGNLFVGTAKGVFRSLDGGDSWIDESEGLPNCTVDALAIIGGYLFAGTIYDIRGRGVWRRPLTEMIGRSSVQLKASSSSFEGNYPNPFTSRTWIRFSLPRAEHVSLKLFNMLGEEAATLVDKDLGAGSHEVEWDAGNAIPGIYFCHITTADGVQTNALVLGGLR